MAGARLKVRKVIAITGFSKGFEIIGWSGGYFSGAGAEEIMAQSILPGWRIWSAQRRS